MSRSCRRSHPIRVDHVLPPVPRHPMRRALYMRKTAEPPQMMRPNIAASPLARGHRTGIASQIGKAQPGVAARGHGARIAPIVIRQTIGREMHIATFRASGVSLVVTGETLPQIRLAVCGRIDFRQHRLGTVTEVFQHFPDAALVVEAHDHETSFCMGGALQRRRITPEGAGSRHDRLVVAAVGIPQQPHLVDLIGVDALDHLEFAHQRQIIDRIRLVELARRPRRRERLGRVAKTIFLHRKAIDHDALHDFVLGVAVAGAADIIAVALHQRVGVVPAVGRADAASVRHDRIVDDRQDARMHRRGRLSAGSYIRRGLGRARTLRVGASCSVGVERMGLTAAEDAAEKVVHKN